MNQSFACAFHYQKRLMQKRANKIVPANNGVYKLLFARSQFILLSDRVPTSSGNCTTVKPNAHKGQNHDALAGTQCTTADVSWCSSQPNAIARASITHFVRKENTGDNTGCRNHSPSSLLSPRWASSTVSLSNELKSKYCQRTHAVQRHFISSETHLQKSW